MDMWVYVGSQVVPCIDGIGMKRGGEREIEREERVCVTETKREDHFNSAVLKRNIAHYLRGFTDLLWSQVNRVDLFILMLQADCEEPLF